MGPLRGHKGVTVWLTGLPSAGKSTIARAMASRLRRDEKRVEVLDGDAMRVVLSKDLGYSRQARSDNVRRIGFVAGLLARNGVIVLCPVVSPYRDDRDAVREAHGGSFLEVHVSTPLDVCRRRDVKGLYAMQEAGELRGLTGVDDPYEAPIAPDAIVPTHDLTVDQSVDIVWTALERFLTAEPPAFDAGCACGPPTSC